jgi:hypothetical protein
MLDEVKQLIVGKQYKFFSHSKREVEQEAKYAIANGKFVIGYEIMAENVSLKTQCYSLITDKEAQINLRSNN